MMVETGWSHHDENPLPGAASKDTIRLMYGQHVRIAQELSGRYFPWTKHQQPGHEPKHYRPHNNGTVVYRDGGFFMVVPTGMYQPVTVGPYTNYGQPCGGYGCCGSPPYCDDCQLEVELRAEEERRAYYDAITPIHDYGWRGGYDDRPQWWEYDYGF